MTIERLHKNRTDRVETRTFSVTTHHVQVDLADVLGRFDPATDEVVLTITTPSGRPKRVRLESSFLVESLPEPHERDLR